MFLSLKIKLFVERVQEPTVREGGEGPERVWSVWAKLQPDLPVDPARENRDGGGLPKAARNSGQVDSQVWKEQRRGEIAAGKKCKTL